MVTCFHEWLPTSIYSVVGHSATQPRPTQQSISIGLPSNPLLLYCYLVLHIVFSQMPAHTPCHLTFPQYSRAHSHVWVYNNSVEAVCCCFADLSDEDWIEGSLKRDQDLTVDLYQLGLVLGRVAAMGGDRDAYQEKMQNDPGYFNGVQ